MLNRLAIIIAGLVFFVIVLMEQIYKYNKENKYLKEQLELKEGSGYNASKLDFLSMARRVRLIVELPIAGKKPSFKGITYQKIIIGTENIKLKGFAFWCNYN